MKRIKYIANLINPSDENIIVDVGSDHAYLAIEVLNQQKASFIYNIEINKNPLEQGISNLKKHNYLDKTKNILNDGLKDINDKLSHSHINYLVIAGMGSNSIIKILSNNSLHVDKFILQTNRNEYALRKWLLSNGYSILEEHIVLERNIYYPLLVVAKKKNWKLYSKKNLKFGKLKLVVDKQLFINYLKNYRDFLVKQNLMNKQKDIKLLNRMVKKYEHKWNL